MVATCATAYRPLFSLQLPTKKKLAPKSHACFNIMLLFNIINILTLLFPTIYKQAKNLTFQ